MIVQKPAILIYSRNPDQDYLREVCAGIEEEGVLYEVRQREECLDELAYLAAAESMLGVGIGIDGERIAMQMSRLPKGRTGHPKILAVQKSGRQQRSGGKENAV